jgi:hypothetical protein
LAQSATDGAQGPTAPYRSKWDAAEIAKAPSPPITNLWQ